MFACFIRNYLRNLRYQTATIMESVSIKKTYKGIWMKKYDDFENSFSRISKDEALESIQIARDQKRMICDGNENSTHTQIFSYWN